MIFKSRKSSREKAVTKEEIDAAISVVEASISSLEWWVIPCAFLVAIGVAGEAFIGVQQLLNNRSLHRLRTAQTELIDKERAKLLTDVADAQKAADEERKERLKLEAKIAPRRLSGEQRDAIISELKTAPVPPEVVIASRLLDAEAIDLGNDLAGALTAAGWRNQRYFNWTMSLKGVFVATMEGSSVGRDNPSIVGLEKALEAAKLGPTPLTITRKQQTTMSPFFQPNVLYVLVGAKP